MLFYSYTGTTQTSNMRKHKIKLGYEISWSYNNVVSMHMSEINLKLYYGSVNCTWSQNQDISVTKFTYLQIYFHVVSFTTC